MARIVGHLSIADLEARYRAAPDVAEARHFQAIWLLAQGRTVLEVSEVLAFVPRWVTRLAARHNASGPGALGDRRRRDGRGGRRRGAARGWGLGGAGLRAALGDAVGGAPQRLRPRGAGRPAAAQRQDGQPADRGRAGPPGQAGAAAAGARGGGA